jgi:hypothetical protein
MMVIWSLIVNAELLQPCLAADHHPLAFVKAVEIRPCLSSAQDRRAAALCVDAPRTTTPRLRWVDRMPWPAHRQTAWPAHAGYAADFVCASGRSRQTRLVDRPESVTWPLMPRILDRSSLRKPFITAMTMISVANAKTMPSKGKPGDNGDESLAPARAQIAPGEHPLEHSEKGAPGGRRFRDRRLRPPCLPLSLSCPLQQSPAGRRHPLGMWP